jgi:hypothetical protein
MAIPLSDDELGAYAQWAAAECDAPLARLVAELQARRAGSGARLAILVLPADCVAILPHLVAQAPPALILAPEGTKLRGLELRGQGATCVLDSYDPAALQALRPLLAKHGILV